jgi:HSP20 family protein
VAFRPDEIARELAALRERMNRLFDEGVTPDKSGTPAWVPSVDVYRVGKRMIITLELPGIEPGDVEISSSGRTLLVGGRRQAAPAGEVGALQLERTWGEFSRSIPLPAGARPAEKKTSFEDGVLRIEIPIG